MHSLYTYHQILISYRGDRKLTKDVKQTEETGTIIKPKAKTNKKSEIFPKYKIPKKLQLANMFEDSDTRLKVKITRKKKTPAPAPDAKSPKNKATELKEEQEKLEVRYIKNCQQEHVLFSSTPSIVNGI